MSSRISNTEWGLIIGTFILIDIGQIILDLFFIGVVANRAIDIVVFPVWFFYQKTRGIKLNSQKIIPLVGTFLLEMVGVQSLDALPLWTAEAIYIMVLYKAEKKAEDLRAGMGHNTEKPNRIALMARAKTGDIKTDPNKVYKKAEGKDLKHLHEKGYLEDDLKPSSAPWFKGENGTSHPVEENSYVLEAPHEVAQTRLVHRNDLSAVYTKHSNGAVTNILNSSKGLESARERHWKRGGENKDEPYKKAA